MNATPSLVSIVLPTYNGARFLADAIDSVLAQTYPYWELIIVDSYSDDSTPSIVARYTARDIRISATQNPKDAGRLPGALNAGFALAGGTYHTWLSDDNLFRPHALQTLVNYLDAHPDIGVVYSDYTLIDGAGQVTGKEVVLPPQSLVEKNVVRQSFMYRCELHQQVEGYRPETFLAEDYDFWLRVSMHTRLQPLHEDLYLYRLHEGSLTGQHRAAIDAAVEKTVTDNLPGLHWAGDYERAQAYLQLVTLSARHHHWRKVLRYWRLAAAHAPYLALRRALLAPLPLRLRTLISQTYVRLKTRLGVRQKNR